MMSKLSDLMNSKEKDTGQEERDDWIIPMECPTEHDVKCKDCNDLGTIMEFHITGGPFQTPSQRGDKWLEINDQKGWWHGKLKVEPCPTCQQRNRTEYLKNRCGLTDDEFEIRLTDYKTSGVLADKADAKSAVAKYAGAGLDLAGFSTLHGSYGVGKTMLGKCLVTELVHNGAPARYALAADLISDIRSNFDENTNPILAVEVALRYWQNMKVLIIDEFDKLNMKTTWTYETIHRLIDARYNARKEKFTMLVMNTAPKDLPEEFGYLASRMLAGNIIHVKGIDVRPGAK